MTTNPKNLFDRHAYQFAGVLLVGAGTVSVACGNSPTTIGYTNSGGSNGDNSWAKPVGAPCVPTNEQVANFSGFGVAEAVIETNSLQCTSKICVANHFQGRVTCPYGQTTTDIANLASDSPQRCRAATTNGTVGTVAVTAAVSPQLVARQAADAVICSCRCAGNDPGASYCTCPAGTTCTPLVPNLGLDGGTSITGSYCIKSGTEYDASVPSVECSETSTDPNTDCGNGRKNL